MSGENRSMDGLFKREDRILEKEWTDRISMWRLIQYINEVILDYSQHFLSPSIAILPDQQS